MRIAVFIAIVLAGCAPSTFYVHGVPNLHPIDRSFYRSGQPTTLAEWRYLHDVLGITDSLKLDFDDEGSDDLARVAGIAVHPLGMLPTTDPSTIVEVVDGLVERPSAERIAELKRIINEIVAENAIHLARGERLRIAVIHCKNGHDRTGLASMFVRVYGDGWSKDQAWAEAKRLGFHPELLGLLREWEDTKVSR